MYSSHEYPSRTTDEGRHFASTTVMTRHVDTSVRHAENARVEARTKRTYRLSARTQARVKELSARYGVAGSQDAVVEVAVDRLYREIEAAAEGDLWAEAASDPAFRTEVADIARSFDDADTWPD